MYLLPKLIALQLLLLCVATKAEDKWWSFTAKGGFFYGPNKYAADENTTVEFVTTYVGDDNTILEWTTTDSKIELNQAVTRKHLGQYSGWLYLPYIITTTLSFTTHGKERPEYHITHDKYSKINNAIIQNHIIEKFMVQYVDGPEISLVGENVEMVDDNGVYSFMENEQFSLNCYAGGLANTTIEWVDQYGKTVIPSQVTELGLLTEMRDTDNGHFQTWQILNVTAKKEMTSFGCRMKAPNYKSSPFEDTNYFEFTVVSKDTVNSNCDPITFDCQNEVVGIGGILNGNEDGEKPFNIWVIVGPLIAALVLFICAVYFGRKVYHNRKNSPNNRIYDVVKHHRNILRHQPLETEGV